MTRVASFAKRYVTALAYTPYALTLGLASARNRGLLASIARHAGASREAQPLLPVVPLSEVLKDDPPVTIRAAEGEYGNVSVTELVILAQLARRLRPATVLEIGTFDGRTALNLAANLDEDARVYTLDLPPDARRETSLPMNAYDASVIARGRPRTRFLGTDCEDRIVQLYGDSATFDFTPYFGTIDFVFVDGAHSYPYVRRDSETALALIAGRTDAVVVWHDYGAIGDVTRALDELQVTERRFARLRHVEGTTLALL